MYTRFNQVGRYIIYSYVAEYAEVHVASCHLEPQGGGRQRKLGELSHLANYRASPGVCARLTLAMF